MSKSRKSNRVTSKSNSTAFQQKKEVWNQRLGFHDYKLTESQLILQEKIQNNTLTFVDAPAGTGKSLTVLHTFVKEYIADNRKKIIVIRTPVEAGMDKIGALPNDYNAKVEPHFASVRQLLENLMSKGKVETDLDNRIKFCIPNYVLGATFDDSLILIDEAQQLPPMILKLLLERVGIGSKVVVAGDSTQLYTDSNSKRNALKDALGRFFYEDNTSKYHDVALHKFTVSDVMRSDIVKTVILAYS